MLSFFGRLIQIHANYFLESWEIYLAKKIFELKTESNEIKTLIYLNPLKILVL